MKPYYADEAVTLYHGDALAVISALPDQSVNCCVTSPPYFGLRDYGEEGQYGLEASPAEYVETMRGVFAEVRRVLAADGTLWLNLGDSYASGIGNKNASGATTLDGSRPAGKVWKPKAQPKYAVPAKNLLGIPWRTALALQDDGWILRNDVIWAKPNAMPESVTDRLSSRHEHLFMLSKSRTYWFDLDAVREPVTTTSVTALNWARDTKEADVWTVPTQPFGEAHFAVMPQALAGRAILAGCKPSGVVLDPFSGSGTTGLAAAKCGRKYVGIDLSREYLDLSLRTRLGQTALIEEEPA